MKINNLKINGFGKIENKEINLSNNINLIYGENEAGKTTLLKFISGIFYGISKNKNKKEFPDYERYKPWQAEEFSGKIEYTLDNKEKYEVFRDFNKKNPKIYKNSEDISKNFNIDKTKGNEFFYEQTGVDEMSFLSTTLIEQKEVVLDSAEQNSLVQKIANLLSTGEENTSYKKTMAALSKKQLEDVGTNRTVGKPINLVTENIGKLMNEQKNVVASNEQKNELLKKQNNSMIKLKDKETKIELLKKILSNKNEEILEDEKIKINNDIINDEKNKINNLKNKIKEKTLNKNKKNKLLNYIILFLLILINILFFIFKINNIIKIISLIFSIIIFAFIILKENKNNKKIKAKKIEQEKILIEIKTAENNIEKIEEKINKINIEKTEKNKQKYILLKNEYEDKIDKEDFEYLWNENKTEVNNILENLEKEINIIKLQIHTGEIEYNNIINKLEEKAKIEEDLQGLLEEKEELLKLDTSINIAKEALERAYNRMKEEITPKFTINLSKIVSKISNEKYNKIKFIDGEGLIVELANGEYINANKLSIGTIDQLYLSLRLSAMEEITEEKMPIILDETFSYYDNQRLENILKYINTELSENQIIIFTCSNREKEILEKNNIKYNYIEI